MKSLQLQRKPFPAQFPEILVKGGVLGNDISDRQDFANVTFDSQPWNPHHSFHSAYRRQQHGRILPFLLDTWALRRACSQSHAAKKWDWVEPGLSSLCC